MLPVKELPQISTDRIEAKTIVTKIRIGIEEHGPVVKLLPEHDIRIAYRSVVIVHGSASRFPAVKARTEADLSRDMERITATSMPGSRYRKGGRVKHKDN